MRKKCLLPLHLLDPRASALAALPDAMPLLQATLHNGDIFYIEISFYSFIRVHQAGYSLTVFEEEAQVLK